MRIAIVNNCVPFLRGGAEHLADALVRKLQEFGHEAALIRVPFTWNPPERIVESMLACRLVRVANVERVIALKFPAYYIPHECKVLWLLHQFRQAYDLWGTPLQELGDTEEGRAIRSAVISADNTHLRQVRKIYTNSRVTSERLLKFNGLSSEVLFPPLLESSHFSCDGYGDYIYYPSRVNAAKRQILMVEAMRFVRTNVRLILSGKAESDEDEQKIRRTIERHGLEQRVEWTNEFAPEERKARLMASALACAYVPYDEDSYGYVTVEAFHSRKPVITCTDSGGTDVLVKDGETGCLVAPDPRVIAETMDRLYMDRALARKMGEQGHALLESLKINWQGVIAKLTQ